ncbi:MAG TPA: hypothetical protein VFM10_08560, partial [Terriglobales bacterium]|nr:hypothetical protein [Terriglobales bacterium]
MRRKGWRFSASSRLGSFRIVKNLSCSRGSKSVALIARLAFAFSPQNQLQQAEDDQAHPKIDHQAEVDGKIAMLARRRQMRRNNKKIQAIADQNSNERLPEIRPEIDPVRTISRGNYHSFRESIIGCWLLVYSIRKLFIPYAERSERTPPPQ